MKKMFKNLKEETLKRLHPHLDLSSIKNSAGERLEEEMWKDIYGNKFSKEIKNCDMLPKFKHIAEVSQETFEKILGLKDIDWKMFKDKSFNEVKTKSEDFEHNGKFYILSLATTDIANVKIINLLN